MKECLSYKILDSGLAQCLACHHFCKIAEGTTGICGIRQNINSKLFLLTYGRPAAVNIDPIEKKPLYHFLPGSKTFSLGTLGCNFRCGNCQNFGISQALEQKENRKDLEKINWGRDLSPAEAVRLAKKNNCASIAYTYNEPTIFFEYALDTMKLAQAAGLKNVWVSNGYMSDKTLDLIIPYLDAINVDIKSFDDKFYQTNCGARLEPVLNNCRRLVKEKIWTEITTLVIPILSDDEKMLDCIAGFIKNELGDFVPWHVSAFSGGISWKLHDLPDTTVEKIKRACSIGKEAGLKNVYAGNI
jgi:pyruvate formate lyase activating enzyme